MHSLHRLVIIIFGMNFKKNIDESQIEHSIFLILQIEVKASSDVKHATDTLNGEKKKRKQLEKAQTDVRFPVSFNVRIIDSLVFLKLSQIINLRKSIKLYNI